MKKILKMLMLIFVVCMIVKVTPEKVQAASCVRLTEGKTYTNMDFTGDGKKDRFKYIITRVNGTAYARVYLNGKYKCQFNLVRGGWLYRCAANTKNIFLITEWGFHTGTASVAYRYSGGKFRLVYNHFGNYSLSYCGPYKCTTNALYMLTSTGKDFGGTFNYRYSRGAQFVQKYNVRNGKISCASRYGTAVGRKAYISRRYFTTSTSVSYMNGKGFRVNYGDVVYLKKVYYSPNGSIWFQIYKNGRYGWIKDSDDYLLY